jgi:putative tricarboxylic transport membrane protein
MMFEAAVDALLILFDPSRLVFMFLGIGVGLTVGILPGLSGPVGMSILLPFIYGMDPYSGMAMLIGMTAVVHTGDTFPSVLMGIPGSSGSQATIMDGYPLAQRGEANRALSASFFCSMIGGVIGAFTLFAVIPIAKPLILTFGSPELFMLAMLGLSMVSIVGGDSPLRGILTGALGLMLGTIGGAPAVPEYRYTFDIIYLFNGISLSILAMGLFAFPEMIDLLAADRSISKVAKLSGSWMEGIKDSIKHKWLLLRSSVLGSIIGFIPGLGGSVVQWISYGMAKQTTRDNENFGKGDIRGVIGPEAANNAIEGGALIPTLLFGIPGSGTTAILLGGLALMGLETGPKLMTTELTLTLTVVWTLVLANFIGAIACIALSKPISRISLISSKILVPFLLVLLLIGAYQITRSWGDFIAFLAIGFLGWIMKRLDWPRVPLLIGFVLALSAERYLWISMSRFGTDWLSRPGVIIIGVITILLLFGGILIKKTGNKDTKGVA